MRFLIEPADFYGLELDAMDPAAHRRERQVHKEKGKYRKPFPRISKERTQYPEVGRSRHLPRQIFTVIPQEKVNIVGSGLADTLLHYTARAPW